MKFAVIGGDTRQNRLADLLRGDGHWVKTAAIGERPGVPCLAEAIQALEGAETVVLPLPAAAGGETLNAPQEKETVSLRELLDHIRPDQRVLAGLVDETLEKLAHERGLHLYDYFRREELTVRNAAITAEGAAQLLMEELPVTVAGTKLLVLGFGRIGKLLALKLRALGALVTVSARSHQDHAWIQSLGLGDVDTRGLKGRLWGYRAVVNTIPAPVLGEALLRELDPGCLCLELASVPGGIDLEAAERLGHTTLTARGLPGLFAPEAAGAAIRDTIYHIISEWECAD